MHVSPRCFKLAQRICTDISGKALRNNHIHHRHVYTHSHASRPVQTHHIGVSAHGDAYFNDNTNILHSICRNKQTRIRTPAHTCTRPFSQILSISPLPDSENSVEYDANTNDAHDFDFGDYSVILPPEPFIFGVSHITPRSVPDGIPRPPYARVQPILHDSGSKAEGSDSNRIPLASQAESRLRRAAQLARDVREFAGTLVKPRVTTLEIDAAVHEYILAHSAYPSPLRYPGTSPYPSLEAEPISGFPRSCCTSVNNIVAHGIPDDRPLENGDIVNVDVTVYLDGYHGDTSQTFLVGEVDSQGVDLVRAANAALEAGISACGPGRPFRGIAEAIHAFVRSSSKGPYQYSICPAFAGHGIGTAFHRAPWIYHTLNEEPGVMLPGHCFTIEPCVVQGSNPRVWVFPDGWTASTENCARSAQAEQMVLITDTGVDVLTR
ncbi:methionine aminopeptidase [Hygrophoropsis aurantiaca]|uniref:Methionine aminopeptidase n=1 Tax=Hygrophoropsis aurantiaca TaxID=72124 RepID=A0ACB8A9P3_9AGAM|nr:methionine aminopeptidase [Hygrophoropsis aurantiaca]